MTIDLDGERIPIEIIRSKRRTIGIQVETDRLLIRAPWFLKDRAIFEVVEEKKELLAKKLRQAEEWSRLHPPTKYEDQERCPYLGGFLTISVVKTEGNTARVSKEGDVLLFVTPDISQERIRELLEKWYRKAAKSLIQDRVEHYLPLVGQRVFVSVNRIVIKEQKSCWGSCSARNNLNFNWHLMEYPLEVVDYVVVHELCHLLHMNHTEAFWAEVERVLPDFRERRAVLKKAGS